MSAKLKAPFPWFGGKSRATELVWARFGDVSNYVEPFFGTGAMLLGAPRTAKRETVNDLDGLLCNFWRAVKHFPEAVADAADCPVNELDLSARHLQLIKEKRKVSDRLSVDPDFFDAELAGWWLWGACAWIGSGWCSGDGPWTSDGEKLVKGGTKGINRKMPHLGDNGQGIDSNPGITRGIPMIGGNGMLGAGINQGRPESRRYFIVQWMLALSERIRDVRVCCGSWDRVTGPSVLRPCSATEPSAIFLDPPYGAKAGRTAVYSEESFSVAEDVLRWCIENGENPQYRIALCGYEGEHVLPASWECVAWKARGGYGTQGDGAGRKNAARERIWFSPACLKPSKQLEIEVSP